MTPPNCTCGIHPCRCKPDPDAERATCPECGAIAVWPDGWEVGGITIDINEEGEIMDTEGSDEGKVFCPECIAIVVPIRAKQTGLPEQLTMFKETH